MAFDLINYIPAEYLSGNEFHITDTSGFKATTLLGEGGFGTVYKYENKKSKVPFAIAAGKHIKQLLGTLGGVQERALREALKTFLNELTVLCKLTQQHSEHTMQFFGYSYSSQEIVLFIEYFKNGSISDMMNRDKSPLKPEISLQYFFQIAQGLEFLHNVKLPPDNRKIVHRDLKCANILLTDDEKCIKLADFGLAFQLAVDSQSFTQSYQTTERTACGTLPFMAPEVILALKYGRRSDVWSLGCTLVEMLTMNPPHYEIYKRYGRQANEVFVKKAHSPPDQQLKYDGNMFLPSELKNTAISQLLDWLFIKDHQKRPKVGSILKVVKPKPSSKTKIIVDLNLLTELKAEKGEDGGITASMFKEEERAKAKARWLCCF